MRVGIAAATVYSKVAKLSFCQMRVSVVAGRARRSQRNLSCRRLNQPIGSEIFLLVILAEKEYKY